MRVLLDTNVLVAALVARGICADLLEHCVRVHRVISSQELLDELEDVLVRKLRQRKTDARSAVKLFGGRSLSSIPKPLQRRSAVIVTMTRFSQPR